MPERYSYISRVLVWVAACAALIPLARLASDWVELNRMLTDPDVQVTGRGFDWVLWQEDEGIIYAAYVMPQGPAAEGGIRAGDVFFMLEYQQYFNAVDLERAIEGIPAGATRTYYVQREGDFIEANVTFTRYPTFIYPLSSGLWHFSVWGFLVAAFIHIIGLIIVGPLAFRSRKAQFSLLLILASSLWIFSNLVRLLMIEFLGPPLAVGSFYERFFQALTGIGLIGWIGFPALLLHKVLGDTFAGRKRIGWTRLGIYLPVVVLGMAALITTVRGSVGPVAIDGLTAPILFYACCYIATAGALMLMHCLVRRRDSDDLFAGWSKTGSLVTLLLALLFGLSVLGVVPIFGVATDTMAGWLIVGAQLLSVAPVVLVSHATLKHGKIDQVLIRALTYVTVAGIVFFLFVGGMSLIEPYTTRLEVSRNVLSGLFAAVLLVGVEWLSRRFKGYGMSLFASERRSMYQAVQQLQEQMRSILDYETLVQRTIDVVGKAFGSRSAVLFLRPAGDAGPWLSANYHPQPPYLTERLVSNVWPYLGSSGRVWAQNPELNESDFPQHVNALLLARGTAILIPIMGKDEPIGLIAMGQKKHRRTVYNLEEIEVLRSLSGQLALAVERLGLVERERMLVRESAEAQLVALRAQINPHFLFNALNTIVSLIEERPDEAEEVVEHLASIFRYILKTGGRAFVTVEDEFELIKHYLSIEKSRFGASLTVKQTLDDACRQHPVPAFAVQTLVENAVKHGLAKRRGGGTLRLRCRRVDNLVEIEVSDTGIGIPDLFEEDGPVTSEQAFFGIGLKNVSARLEQLYGRSDLLHISSSPDEGTTVVVQLPAGDAARNGADIPALEESATRSSKPNGHAVSSSSEL